MAEAVPHFRLFDRYRARSSRSGRKGRKKADVRVVKQRHEPAHPKWAHFDVPSLRTVYSPQKTSATVDIVFVHGLQGGSQTWSSKDVLWPQDLLRKEVPDARIMMFSYSTTSSTTDSDSFRQISNDLLRSLRNKRKNINARPVIFVAHSLGGIIVKQSFVESLTSPTSSLQEIASNVIGILFFGTPHKGSDSAGWTRVLSKIIPVFNGNKSNLSSLMSLRSFPEDLTALDQKFFTAVHKNEGRNGRVALEIVSFYEERPIPGIGIVVPAKNAELPGFISMGLPADHINLSKFASKDDIGYTRFVSVIGRIIRNSLRTGHVELSSKPVVPTGTPPVTVRRTLARAESYGQAEELQRQAVEITRLTTSRTDSRFLLERKRLADIYFARGLWTNAEDALHEILQNIGDDGSQYPESLSIAVRSSLALIYLEQNRLTDAYPLLSSPSTSQASNNEQFIRQDIMAALHFRQRKLKESLEIRTRLVHEAETMYGDWSSMALQAATFRTLVLTATESHSALVKSCGEQRITLKNLKDKFVAHHPIVLRQKSILSFLLIKMLTASGAASESMEQKHALQDAIELGSAAVYGLRETIGPDHLYAMHASHNHAICLAFDGRLSEARSISTSVTQDLKRNRIDDTHPLTTASRCLKSMLQASDSLEDLVAERDPATLLVNWAASAQWLPDLIFSGAIFEGPDVEDTTGERVS